MSWITKSGDVRVAEDKKWLDSLRSAVIGPPPQPSPAVASYAARLSPGSEGEVGSHSAHFAHGATLKMRKRTRKRKRKRKRKTLKPVGIQIFLFLVLFLEILLFRL